MGIRFYCPNGHKLNVKSSQAGKRGYCPKCQTKLMVPLESAPSLAQSEPAGMAIDIPTSQEGDVGASAALSTAQVGSGPRVEAVPKMLPSDESEAHWYLCPPSGGQYGPVGLDMMEQWIAEGRVTEDSLVWRNGWADWQAAGKVFESFESTAPTDGSSDQPAGERTIGSAAASRPDQRKSDRMRVAGIVFLLLAALLLTGALALLWQ